MFRALLMELIYKEKIELFLLYCNFTLLEQNTEILLPPPPIKTQNYIVVSFPCITYAAIALKVIVVSTC